MRREPLVAALLCLVGSFLALVSAGRTWVTVEVAGSQLLAPQALGVTGSDLAPGLGALGLAGLAGVLALAGSRGRGRLLVGAVLLAVGAGLAAAVVALAAQGLSRAALRTDGVRELGAQPVVTSTSAWPWACLLGGLLLAAAGLLVAVRGRRWAALGRRYESPAVAPEPAPVEGPVAERELWEALDRGDDPTAADPEGRSADHRG